MQGSHRPTPDRCAVRSASLSHSAARLLLWCAPLLLALFSMALSAAVHAAPAPCADKFGYTCADEPSSFLPAQERQLPGTGDDYVSTVTLPFLFPFYGQEYGQLHINSNGMLSFVRRTLAYDNAPLALSSAPPAMIAPFWDDLYVKFGQSALRTESRGVAPRRQFVIEWSNLRFNCCEQYLSAQVILHENGEILFQYAGVDANNVRERGNSATIGIKDHTGLHFIQYSHLKAVVSDGVAIRFTPPNLTPPPPADKQGPAITIDSPVNAAVFVLGTPVGASYTCSDPSGVAQCAGPVASGVPVDTASVGTKTFRVTATDTLGNASAHSAAYQVVYRFTGFFSPVEVSNQPERVYNMAKAGSAVPIKFSLAGNQGMDILGTSAPASKRASCSSSTSAEPLEDIDMPGKSQMTYDAASDRYHFNWKTDKAWAGTCRIFVLTLKDGTEHVAYFNFAK